MGPSASGLTRSPERPSVVYSFNCIMTSFYRFTNNQSDKRTEDIYEMKVGKAEIVSFVTQTFDRLEVRCPGCRCGSEENANQCRHQDRDDHRPSRDWHAVIGDETYGEWQSQTN